MRVVAERSARIRIPIYVILNGMYMQIYGSAVDGPMGGGRVLEGSVGHSKGCYFKCNIPRRRRMATSFVVPLPCGSVWNNRMVLTTPVGWGGSFWKHDTGGSVAAAPLCYP